MSLFSDAVINFFVNSKDAENSLGGLEKKFNQTVNSIQNGLIGKLGGITAGVLGIQSITQVYDETLKLVNLSERWNLPVEKVSQFANAFAQFGGDADSAIGMIEKLQQAANSLRFESSGPLKDLSAIMGTNLFNKDYLGAIKALRSEFRTLNENAQVKVTDMLGGDITLQRMLKASDEEFAAILEKSQKFGTISEKTASSMRKLDRSLATIKQAFKAISGASLERLVPVFDKLSGFMENLALSSDDVKVGILGILGAVTLLGPALSVLKVLLGGLFNPFNLGVGLAIAGVYLLYQNWDKVTEAFNKFMAESPRLIEFCQAIADGFSLIGDVFRWLADTSDNWFPVLKNIFSFVDKYVPILTRPLELLSKIGSGLVDIGNATGGFIAGAVSEGSWEGAVRGAVYGMEHIPPAATMRAAQSYSSINNTTNNRNQQNQTIINRGTTTVTINGVKGAEDIVPQLRSTVQNNMLPIGYTPMTSPTR